jgi:hypothetical protein
MNYTVIEFTPGYLPEDDDPPIFDQFNEALNYLEERRRELFEDDYSYSYPPEDKDGDPVFELEVHEVHGDPPYKQFEYYDNRKMHDLGRVVEIVPYEAPDEQIEKSFDAYR